MTLALAAAIPVALTLWLIFGPGLGGSDPAGGSEMALIEDLDLLEVLSELAPEDLEDLDPEWLDLYQDWELLEDLPLEILES